MINYVDEVVTLENTSTGETVEFKKWNFPAGEVGVKLPDTFDAHCSHAVFLNSAKSEDIMTALMLIDALNGAGCFHITLGIGYLPYGRQDRVCHKGEAFSVGLFARMIKAAGVNQVIIADPHSNVFAKELVELGVSGVLVMPQHFCMRSIPKFDVLIAPDAGARDKIKHHKQAYSSTEPNPTKIITLSKVRENGVVKYEDLEFDTVEGNVAVVDDICDGGATFISLAEMLTRTQPNIDSLTLCVTHGIFSKGVDELKKYYTQIMVYNLLNKDVVNQVKEL